jgi:uncharacterized membrane protein
MISLFTFGGALFLLRWLHFLGGITWIGMLYYLNFVHGGFMAATDAPTKSQVMNNLFPKVMWYFRWGAMLTFLSGICYLGISHPPAHTSYAVAIYTGATFATLMWANVWFVIWPAQKINIAVAQGKMQAPANLPGRIARAGVCSRTNVLFSFPMLFCMGAASHLGIQVAETANLCVYAGVIGVIMLLLELNALKGKSGPMTTVKGVIHCGIGLAIVTYAIMEFLTK